MSRTLAAAVSGLTCALAGWYAAGSVASRALAQTDAAPQVELAVRVPVNGAGRCFEQTALQQRIAHYGGTRLARARDLRLELEVAAADRAELLVYRGGELVARRQFDQLPEACADRRDAVALSIALALEGVIRALPEDGAPGSAPAAQPSAATTAESSAEASSAALRGETSASQSEAADAAAPAAVSGGERAARPPLTAAEAESRPSPDSEPRDAEPVEVPAQPGGVPGEPLAVKLHAGVRWLAHALPAPVWTGTVGLALWLDRALALELSALASTLGEFRFAAGRVEARLFGGELLGCQTRRFHPWAAEGCVGAVLASCSARGRDYPVAFPGASLLWAAGTARLALLWPSEEVVSLRMVVQGHVSLVRPELRVDGSRERLKPFWLGGSAGLDLVVAFD